MSDETTRKILRGDVIDVAVRGEKEGRSGKPRTPPRVDADEFILGVGTDQEQSIRWPPEMTPLRSYFAHTDEQLRRMRNFFDHPARKNNMCMIDGIWLVWCYAAIDVSNLYRAIGALSDEVEELRAEIRELRARLDGPLVLPAAPTE